MTIEVAYGRKITGSAETLNYISLAFDEAAERQEEKGYHHTAKTYRRDAKTIYDALLEKGFYKERGM